MKLEIAIAVLTDGRVVFGDLPPDLAEVRDVLAGEVQAEGITCAVRASDTLDAQLARTASGDPPA